METNKILSKIDHTALKAVTAWDDIEKLCDEAVKYSTASVCIPPCYISRVREHYKNLNICTVIGFPLGYQTTAVKVFETQDAIKNGADEIDMVINQTDVKNHQFDFIEDEIRKIKNVCGDKILKVIIETCYLSNEEKTKLCSCVTNAKANYIKTSTGFGTAGADINDIKLFKNFIGDDVKIKAAGGVKTRDDLEMFINEGCDRIGTSSAVTILTTGEVKDY